MESMKLDGGIDTYRFGKRYMTESPPLGRSVAYLEENGCEDDREYTSKLFQKGKILTIKEIYVGRSSSEVEFLEYPHMKFNTVMFADVE